MHVDIVINNIKSQLSFKEEGVVVIPPMCVDKEGKTVLHPVIGALENELTYYMEAHINGQMRELPVRRFSVKTYKFDTGCLSYVTKTLKQFGLDFKMIDRRTPVPPGVPIPLREGCSLRAYQADVVDTAFRVGRGVLKLATGAGKTVIGSALVGRLNLPTVVFVHTIDLLEQFRDEMQYFLNVEVGQIGGGIIDPKRFTICMMQTGCRAFDAKYVKYEVEDDDDQDDSTNYSMQQKATIRQCIEQAQVVISDECHHSSCSTLQTLFKSAKSAYYRYGLTATLREDGADILIHGITGRVIGDISASYLIEHDPPYLVRPHIYYVKVSKPRGSTGTYHQRYKNDIVENKERNELAVQSAMRLVKQGHKVLVLAKHIKHLKLLKSLIEDGFDSMWPDLREYDSREITLELATGAVKKEERRRIIGEMRAGTLQCMLASTIADEGLNCPPISAVILAGGGKSATKAFQRVGRALRMFEYANGVKKEKAVIVDFYDQGRFFKKHAERRMELFKKEPAFIIKVQQ
jgi:superfamily II DNA or RNA helicase